MIELTKQHLYSLDAPYVLLARATESALCNFGWSMALSETSPLVVRFLRGQRIRTSRQLFDEFAAALQFPYYFGHNWNAMDECLIDFQWLPGDGYVICIQDAHRLLDEETPAGFDTLMRVLQDAAKEWSLPVAIGEWWDRPGKPFHVVLHAPADGFEKLVRRVEATSISPAVLIGVDSYDRGQAQGT